MNPGDSHSEEVSVFTGDVPIGKGDIIFVFDRTGSMTDEIDQAKTSAIDIMDDIRERLPYAWFGVGSFMDYPGYFSYPGYASTYGSSSYGDVPWELNIQNTDNISLVADTINNLTLGSGEDAPEDYTRALYEVNQDVVGWRDDAKKIVLLFGDAPTHDLNFAGYNFGGDPGRDGIAMTSDDLDFETVVQQAANAGISVIAIDSGYTSESEATFKGMSIGFASAPGTNGHYYSLSNSSEIPDVVVQLITEETQIIDTLHLEVTAGYEDWFESNPTEAHDVPANHTQTFDVTITVPDDADPGFYPFAIQAIGDSAILGLTYVEVTIPTDSPINDLGFRPNQDGFDFRNEDSTRTWEMFRQFFGTENVEYTNGDKIYAANIFFDDPLDEEADDYRGPSGGSCDGYSAASLINYFELEQPNSGDYVMPPYSNLYNTDRNDEMWDSIVYYQGTQKGLEVNQHWANMCEFISTPSAMYSYLKSIIENNSEAIVWILWDEDYFSRSFIPPFERTRILSAGGGHSLAPYRFEEPSSNEAYVYVYDSNYPGNNELRIEFDLDDETWEYTIPMALATDITLVGDRDTCLLNVIPLDLYTHQGIAPWRFLGSTFDVFSTTGPINLLFTDDEGRHLGWQNGDFYDDIPGASYIPTSYGDENLSGSYYLPRDIYYTSSLQGLGSGQASVSVWGNAKYFSLSEIGVYSETVAFVDIASDDSSITLSDATTDIQGALAVSNIFSDQDHTVLIRNLAVSPGEEVSVSLNDDGITDTIEFTTNSLIQRTFDISIQRAGGIGYSNFGHSFVPFYAGSTGSIRIPDWSNLDTLNYEIDLNKDGTIDDIKSLRDEVAPNQIFIQAVKTVTHIGAEPINLDISVRDQFGGYAPNGTVVNFETSLGSLSSNTASTTGGHISLNFTPGDVGGFARISASVNGIENSISIHIKGGYEVFLPKITGGSKGGGFDSQFNGSSDGWEYFGSVWTVGYDYLGTTGLEGIWASAANNGTYSDFDYSTRIRHSGCEACSTGLIVRGSPIPFGAENRWDSGYSFYINHFGQYSVWKYINGNGTALQYWVNSPAINTDSSWNILRSVAIGSNLYFYINDTLVWSGSDTTYTSGSVGIIMYRTAESTGDQLWADWATLDILSTTAAKYFDQETVSVDQEQWNADARNNPTGDDRKSP